MAPSRTLNRELPPIADLLELAAPLGQSNPATADVGGFNRALAEASVPLAIERHAALGG